MYYTIPDGFKNKYKSEATTTIPITTQSAAVPASHPVVLVSKIPVICGASRLTANITPSVIAKIAPTTCFALKFDIADTYPTHAPRPMLANKERTNKLI